MTAENHDRRPNPATAAEQVLRLAADRGFISHDQAESTIVQVRERLLSAGLYDSDDASLELVIPDELLRNDTLARLARELGYEDEDWFPRPPSDSGGNIDPQMSSDPFEVFPVSGWDRYEFVEFIGRGGMGDVFKARDPRLGRHVALKFLRRDDPEQVKRFLREAKVQAKVEHENLCPVYEVGEAGGHSYIAMQYVAGGSIKEIADLVGIQEKVEIMVDVADALHAAHQAGLIHRDIKPANILVDCTPEGAWHPYVVDFGIAREVDTPHDLTISGMVLGTPAFCSPEQVRGETSKLDRRTDVYGIGATLYWFLTGQSPYAGAYPEVVAGVTEKDPLPPHRVDPSIPVDLETIVLKCLEKEQDRRYATAREVSEDLRRFLGREPIAARPASLLYKLNKWIRKNPGLVAAAVIVALSFAALGSLALRSILRTRRQAAIAQSLTERAKEIEGFARVAAMMPLHDRTSERGVIRQQMLDIEAEMARLGSISDGPGHYALGRGYLTLLDDQKARQHLELAIDRGYSGPGVSYALGMVLGRLYQRELGLARRLENENLRTARIREIEQQLRDPALTYLRSGSGSSIEGTGYAEALIAFFDGDLDGALEATRQAFAEEAWLYEAKRLEGDILLEMGAGRALHGDADGALEMLEEAGGAYALAANIARSDPSVYEGECGRWTQIMELQRRRGEEVLEPFNSAVAACDRSLAIDPERASVHERLSHLYWRWADLVNDRGGDSGPFLDQAIAAADRAIGLDPESVPAFFTRGGALTVTALGEMARGEDPRPTLNDAVSSFESAIAIDPGFVLAHDDLGYAWELLGRYQMGIGTDPRPSLERAVEAFERANDLNPAYANAYNNRGIALWRTGIYELRTGANPTGTFSGAVAAFDSAIERNPDYAYAWANRGLAGRWLARYELAIGNDPSATLDRARTDLQRALELNPQIFWAYPELTAVELAAALWAMQMNESPVRYLDAAEAAASKALVANPRNATAYQSAAEVARCRAEWKLRQGRSVRADLVEGNRLIEEAFERNPELANAMVTEAWLKIIQAEAESDPRSRSALASEASSSLQRALEANPLLERETEELRDRITRLNSI
ncbi:MAG: protein kinase [Acidobacteria bacterium]|nr:protein kinase [Acidobacteriota bacterium]